MTVTITQMAKLLKKEQKKAVEAASEEQVVMPMFLPAKIPKGSKGSILDVTTRQKFLSEAYEVWITWHTTRGLAIFFGVLTLILLPISLWIASASALAAGYYYSDHVRQALRIKNQYSKRRMLYTR